MLRRWAPAVAALAIVVGMVLAVVVAAGAVTRSVAIVDDAYSQPSIDVTAGTTVTWTNTGQDPHSVTSDSGLFDSGAACTPMGGAACLQHGQTFSFTFSKAGTFTYHCRVHSFMHGTVVVSAAAPTTTAAPPTTVVAPAPATTRAVTTTVAPVTTAAPTTTSVPPATTTSVAPTTTTVGAAVAPPTSTAGSTPPVTAAAAAARPLAHTGSSPWVPILAAVAVVLAAGGGVAAWRLRRPG